MQSRISRAGFFMVAATPCHVRNNRDKRIGVKQEEREATTQVILEKSGISTGFLITELYFQNFIY